MGNVILVAVVIFFLWILNLALTPGYEAEQKQQQEELAAARLELERLKSLSSGYDPISARERREAQALSNELRSKGIGISPEQARGLLQTEKDLMNE